jgi:Zn-dependent peptidase ImmA (M78 family)
MTTFGPEGFRVEVEDRRPAAAASTESRTLANVRLSSGGHVLTRWIDVEDGERFEWIPDIPLIDLASWLASSWGALIYDLVVPSFFRVNRVSFAQRWALSALVAGTASERTYAWASQHALEFAATDYVFPNVVFQRRDDFIEVSWFPRAKAASGSTVVYEGAPGSTLVGVREFVALCREILAWVAERVADVERDPRVDAIRASLQVDPGPEAVRVLGGWFPDWKEARIRIPEADLIALGRFGVAASAPVMFLRSAVGEITAREASGLLAAFTRARARPDRVAAELPDLGKKVDTTIDPRAPWESGYRLARVVRHDVLESSPDAPVDVERVLRDRGVTVLKHAFQSPTVEGACFVQEDGYALALYNPGGRLSRTTVGRRTTLAHELCHMLFDARDHAMGQLDRRESPAGSLLEKRANAFAAELLLPQEVVLARASSGRLSRAAMLDLAQKYRVSRLVVQHQAENQDVSVSGAS